MTGEIRFRRRHVEAMTTHARSGLPNEACGLFTGLEDRVHEVHALANADPTPVSYLVDSRDQFRVMRRAETDGMEVLGCFHSHVQSPAVPSAVDVAQAFYPEWVYVVIGLRDRESPEIRAFRIVDGEVSELSLLVED